MARMIRVHAAADAFAVARVRAALEPSGIPSTAVTVHAGDLVGDVVEVEIPDELGFEEESTLRGRILGALAGPPPSGLGDVAEIRDEVVRQAGRIEALESVVAGLVAGLNPSRAANAPV